MRQSGGENHTKVKRLGSMWSCSVLPVLVKLNVNEWFMALNLLCLQLPIFEQARFVQLCTKGWARQGGI